VKPKPKDTMAKDAAPPAARSRRSFLTTIAAGTLAAVAASAMTTTAATTHRKPAKKKSTAPAAATSRPAAIETEIKNQKGYTARSLGVIRDFPLPPGSEMAFAFVPMKARPRPDDRKRR
jgi:secreted PhoX family phosphatase